MTTMREAIAAGKKLRIVPYKVGSGSATLLRDYIQQETRKKIYILDKNKALQEPGRMFLNWGCSNLPVNRYRIVGASPALVALAAEKSGWFRYLVRESPRSVEHLPAFTTLASDAVAMIADGKTVVARHSTTSHSGIGAQVVSGDGVLYSADDVKDQSWLKAKLFTEYFHKSQEYRVFVLQGRVILTRRKRKTNGVEEQTYSKYIRVHNTGWNYCAVQDDEVPAAVRTAALAIDRCTGRSSGVVAYDVGYRERDGKAVVFEANTAPGIVGETVKIIGDSLLDMELPYELDVY